MKARSSEELLDQLRQRTEDNLAIAESFQKLSLEVLQRKSTPKSWNALECLAHLNHFSKYYLPEIRKKITGSKYPAQARFTSSRLGNYFAKGMKPGEKMRAIKTLPSGDPLKFKSPVTPGALNDFIRDQKELLALLDGAAEVDLTKTKTGISITQLIKLRLGDTLRVVVYHNWRHLEQALRAIG